MPEYRTIQGDNWDLIAYRVYEGLGGEKLTSALIDANPQYVLMVEFPAGCILEIPEVYIPAAKTLPPWLR
ncbi:MAG: tail protein X [Synergistaceae bacterium]|nr:tail protein X [Synergistaceae bacterium]